MEVKGIDISQWQKGMNLSDLKNRGFNFAILRGGLVMVRVGLKIKTTALKTFTIKLNNTA